MAEGKRLNVAAAVGAGRYRRPFRIREHLVEVHDLSFTEIDQRLDIPRGTTSATVRGRRNDRRVLAYLKDVLHVPVDLLGLPKDMQEAAAQ